MRSTRLQFENRHGQSLAARLDEPVDGQPHTFALFAHCFTCTKNLRAVGNINRALTRAGIAVLRFDFTGLGESEGEFADTNFSSNVSDLVDAAAFLAESYAAPALLIGHSLGGAAVLQAAAEIPSAQALVTIGAPASPEHVSGLLQSSRAEIEEEGEAVVQLAGRPFRIKKQFLDDLNGQKMQETIRNLRTALLICHAPLDNQVGIDNAAQIFQQARHPKSFLSLDDADHLLSEPADSQYVGGVIAAWAARYLDSSPQEQKSDTATEPAPRRDAQVFVRTGQEQYRTEIRANRHSLVADEPQSLGGTDEGPTPYDLLLAALGACTSITLRMYADRKQWPLEAIHVELDHSKTHAEDCVECEKKSSKLDLIQRRIGLVGALSDEQEARLMEIADRCPVHRTLHSEILVRTSAIEDSAEDSR